MAAIALDLEDGRSLSGALLFIYWLVIRAGLNELRPAGGASLANVFAFLGTELIDCTGLGKEAILIVFSLLRSPSYKNENKS